VGCVGCVGCVGLPLLLACCLAFFFPLPVPAGLAAGWLGAGGEVAAAGVVSASSRVAGAGPGVGFGGAGFGARSDRPALEEWRLDVGVLALRVEPDRLAGRKPAD